ncbi:MAG: general secretion pathway protein GspK [Planctomycetes bacterium]|nr:general secretion pathway protein GspK [Planctomycetota bacterium]
MNFRTRFKISSEMGSGSHHCRGVVFILVLMVLATLTTLAMGLVWKTRIEMELVSHQAQKLQAHYLALGGIERSLTHVANTLASSAPEDPLMIPCFIRSAQEEDLLVAFSDSFKETSSTVCYSVRDEQGCLNINATRDDIVERALDRALTCQIMDWRDSDDAPMGSEGVESQGYQTLQPGYRAKNADFEHIRELLFLPDVSFENYVGEDLNGNQTLDDNESDGDLSLPMDNQDSTLDLGLMDLVTTYGNGKININAAPHQILAGMPGMDDYAAQCIVSYRQGRDGRWGSDDDNLLLSNRDLSDIVGLTGVQRSLLQQHGCFTSGYLRVQACAQVSPMARCRFVGTIELSDNLAQLIYLERLY